MKVVILAGGLGSRLQEETTVKPKPMVEIGGHPILWHIMHIYAAYGFKEFVVALGYKAEVVKSYFLNYKPMANDISVNLKTGEVVVHPQEKEDWLVHLVDTGQNTQTGGRIKRLEKYLDDDTFMLTYGDGVADININELLAFHKSHGKLATVTAVRPPGRFGGITLNESQVIGFAEKPQIGEGWINGGFFVCEPKVIDFISDDTTLWEHEPMTQLAREGQLKAFCHTSFWQCMDTLRDMRTLESLWSENQAPWKVW
jgi:glucose-1-phosphate cytidylyltransferase